MNSLVDPVNAVFTIFVLYMHIKDMDFFVGVNGSLAIAGHSFTEFELAETMPIAVRCGRVIAAFILS